jgi:hypothetical protein
MRLVAVVAVLAILVWLAAEQLSSAGSSSTPAGGMSVRQAQTVAGDAQKRVQQSERRGQQALEQAMRSAAPSQP